MKMSLSHLSGTNFFWYKPLLSRSPTYWDFHYAKFKKALIADPEFWGYAIFLGPKWSICPKQIFLGEIFNIILIYLLATFIVQNLKKILDVQFLGPK